MENNKKLPPKTEWKNLTISQLLDLKNDMYDIYFGLRGANASFANQYLGFINELDALISRKQIEAEMGTNQD
jgi:hypothetical protein